MNDVEQCTALITTISTVVLELENIKEMVSALTNNGPSRNEPVPLLTHSAQVNAFVYSADLKVSLAQYSTIPRNENKH